MTAISSLCTQRSNPSPWWPMPCLIVLHGVMVLDAFLGSGTTLLAAERVGRHCYGIEIDPLYVDVAIRRWQKFTGERAIHQSKKSFDELAESRPEKGE